LAESEGWAEKSERLPRPPLQALPSAVFFGDFPAFDLSVRQAAYTLTRFRSLPLRERKIVMAKTKRKLAHSQALLQRQLPFSHEGRYFDLRAIFDRLNARYFSARPLADYTITWGRRRKLPPKEYFVFGTIQEEDRVIRIHPRLDALFVPLWFVEYVVYHEMLHSVVPDEPGVGGRRCVHTDEFYRRERQFAHYRKARRWEEENLARFLR
jgi:hypothetical protein